jgi:beta-lactam-binding protein with PASTA domain/predicted Ser/Thr protein kinase
MDLVNDSPRVLGNRYEVGELLGRGGMAEVHLGRDARLGRTVAIKLLRTDLARDSTFQARFRREAQSAAALNHPAIVAVYDTGEEQIVESGGGVFNLPYIVMEHIEGRTLRDVLAEGHHLDVDSALDIITGVLTALEYSHRIGIVHRDIKPANVMLTPIGDVKVMDFGIARAMSDASSTMTQTQAVIGTAQYLSPEQARGEQVDTRSDLYSAGCMLYELLTGRPPFVADSPVAVAYQHVREAPVPPSRVVGGIPDSVDRIVLHSLAKGREERYQSAADFRADVEAARGGRQVSAAVPVMHGSNATTQYVPMQDPNGTRVAPVAGMAAGGALLGGAMAGQGGQDPYDPYNQGYQNQGYNPNDPYNQGGNDYGQREQEPKSNWKMILAGIAVVVVVALVGFLVAKQLNSSSGGNNTATTIEVPDVVGKLQALAEEDLSKAGFTNVTVQQVTSSEDKNGKVTEQDPVAKTQAAKTAAIVLKVGSGPNTVDVPDVTGMSQNEARGALEAKKLQVGDVNVEDSPDVPKGKVIRTDPANGESVKIDTTVNLYISSGSVDVPDVTDKTENQAKNILRKAGLKVQIEREPSEAPVGRVTRTDPDPGSRAKEGSTVTVYISQGTPTATTTPATTAPSPTATPTPTDTSGDG